MAAAMEQTRSSGSDSEEEYEVEKIVGMCESKGETLYKVRWLNYSPSWDTWEPYGNLESCREMMMEYRKKHEKQLAKQKDKKICEDEDEGESVVEVSSTTRKPKQKKHTFVYVSSDEEEANTLKDRFWHDLEQGKIILDGSDLYSKVKSQGRSARPQSFENMFKDLRRGPSCNGNRVKMNMKRNAPSNSKKCGRPHKASKHLDAGSKKVIAKTNSDAKKTSDAMNTVTNSDAVTAKTNCDPRMTVTNTGAVTTNTSTDAAVRKTKPVTVSASVRAADGGSDEEVDTIKDSFWRDLEEGKINVFGSDLYSKVKGVGRSARPKSFQNMFKIRQPRVKKECKESKHVAVRHVATPASVQSHTSSSHSPVTAVDGGPVTADEHQVDEASPGSSQVTRPCSVDIKATDSVDIMEQCNKTSDFCGPGLAGSIPKVKVGCTGSEVSCSSSDSKTSVICIDPDVSDSNSDPKVSDPNISDCNNDLKVSDSNIDTKVSNSDPNVSNSNNDLKVSDSNSDLKVSNSDPKVNNSNSDPKNSNSDPKVSDNNIDRKNSNSDPKVSNIDLENSNSDPKVSVRCVDSEVSMSNSDEDDLPLWYHVKSVSSDLGTSEVVDGENESVSHTTDELPAAESNNCVSSVDPVTSDASPVSLSLSVTSMSPAVSSPGYGQPTVPHEANLTHLVPTYSESHPVAASASTHPDTVNVTCPRQAVPHNTVAMTTPCPLSGQIQQTGGMSTSLTSLIHLNSRPMENEQHCGAGAGAGGRPQLVLPSRLSPGAHSMGADYAKLATQSAQTSVSILPLVGEHPRTCSFDNPVSHVPVMGGARSRTCSVDNAVSTMPLMGVPNSHTVHGERPRMCFVDNAGFGMPLMDYPVPEMSSKPTRSSVEHSKLPMSFQECAGSRPSLVDWDMGVGGCSMFQVNSAINGAPSCQISPKPAVVGFCEQAMSFAPVVDYSDNVGVDNSRCVLSGSVFMPLPSQVCVDSVMSPMHYYHAVSAASKYPLNHAGQPLDPSAALMPPVSALMPPTINALMPPSTSVLMPPSVSSLMPPTVNALMPPSSSALMPPSISSLMPPSVSGLMPPSSGTLMPPSVNALMPPSVSALMPPTVNAHMPPAVSALMPPSTSALMPPSTSALMPPSTSALMPPSVSALMPPTASAFNCHPDAVARTAQTNPALVQHTRDSVGTSTAKPATASYTHETHSTPRGRVQAVEPNTGIDHLQHSSNHTHRLQDIDERFPVDIQTDLRQEYTACKQGVKPERQEDDDFLQLDFNIEPIGAAMKANKTKSFISIGEVTNVAILHAVETNDLDLVECALSTAVFDLNQRNVAGLTLTMIAARHGFDNIVEVLVRHGASVNAVTKTGATALIMATEMGLRCTVELLLMLGAHMNIRTQTFETALIKAIKLGHKTIVKLLLDYGANFGCPQNDNMTALDYAMACKSTDCLDVLSWHISRLTNEFEKQMLVTLNKTAKIVSLIFPMQCFALCEGHKFKVVFQHELQPTRVGAGMLLFIAHTQLTSSKVQCRFYGASAVTSVTLNGVTLHAVTKESNFVMSFSPLQDRVNELVIHTVHTPTSKTKLVVCAYKAQLM